MSFDPVSNTVRTQVWLKLPQKEAQVFQDLAKTLGVSPGDILSGMVLRSLVNLKDWVEKEQAALTPSAPKVAPKKPRNRKPKAKKPPVTAAPEVYNERALYKQGKVFIKRKPMTLAEYVGPALGNKIAQRPTRRNPGMN